MWLLALAAAVIAAYAALRAPSLPPAAAVERLVDVTVVTPGVGRVAGRSIELRDGRITAVRAVRPDDPRGPEAGSYALPGLVDLHVHHPPSLALGERELFALLFLRHGVTSVRDVGSGADDVFGLRARIASGELAGPRLYACGPFLDGDPPAWPGARGVRGPDDAARAVDELAAAGADCVKLYNDLRVGEIAAAREAARRHGLPVVAHVPFGLDIAALGDGVEVQHLMGLSQHWTRVPRSAIERYVERSLDQGLAHTPTLVAFARSARLTEPTALRADPRAALLPSHWREIVWDPARNPVVWAQSPQGGSGVEARVAVMQQTLAALHARGVPLRAGTDVLNPFVMPGESLHAELALLAEAGLGVEGAWQAATAGAAEALREPRLGSLAPGHYADLLLFRRDPTRDLAALDSLEAVVAAGRLYPREALDGALARARRYFEGALRRQLGALAARLAVRQLGPAPAAAAETLRTRPARRTDGGFRPESD